MGFLLGVFDALGNFHFLFAGEQGNLAHLLEVHANGVVQDVMAACFGLLFLGLFLLGLVVVYLVWVEYVDFQILQDGNDVIDFVLGIDAFWERFVNVVMGQVALFLRLSNKVSDTLVHLVLSERGLAGFFAFLLAWHVL